MTTTKLESFEERVSNAIERCPKIVRDHIANLERDVQSWKRLCAEQTHGGLSPFWYETVHDMGRNGRGEERHLPEFANLSVFKGEEQLRLSVCRDHLMVMGAGATSIIIRPSSSNVAYLKAADSL